MEPQEDVIVDIPEKRQKFFGCSGKMLLPSPATVAAQIETIPEHQLVTMDRLQKRLAAQFNVEVACPIATRNALQAIAKDASTQVAYWRVIKKDGALFALFPGGVEGHAARLRKEGFTIDTEGKVPKVHNFTEDLVRSA
jgi:alkylated DNA nucleotide flippase Atl1